jgi:hypothetical protein
MSKPTIISLIDVETRAIVNRLITLVYQANSTLLRSAGRGSKTSLNSSGNHL